MHLLLIVVALVLGFPLLARLVGWMISAMFWLFAVVVLFYLIQDMTH
jgi:hypothetical protein